MKEKKEFRKIRPLLCLLLAVILICGIVPIEPTFASGDETARGTERLSEPGGTDTESDESEPIESIETEPTTGTKSDTYTNSISSVLWIDANGDGTYDSDEQPLADYPVCLYLEGETDNAVQTATTDVDGKYLFENMEPGSYAAGIKSEENGTEYLLPLVGVQKDNKFYFTPDYSKVISTPIDIGANTVVENIDAGMRTPPKIAPMAAYTINLASPAAVTGVTYASGVLTFTTAANNHTYTITGTTTTTRIVVQTGVTANITLSGVDIRSAAASPILLQGTAAVNLTIVGTNILSASSVPTAVGNYGAGIHVPSDAALTINGTASDTLTVTAGSGAGIGGSYLASTTYPITSNAAGTITINGGTVTAIGGGTYSGAGIGGSLGASAGKITINGGAVTATGGGTYSAAGIGGGYMSDGSGEIIINGGTVTARGGGNSIFANGAGIGGGGAASASGYIGGNGGNITITDGTITAIGGTGTTGGSTSGGGSGAGIGGGSSRVGVGNGGNITITGGTIIAEGGGTARNANAFGGAAGIGGGGSGCSGSGGAQAGGSGGIITISGGTITTVGGSGGIYNGGGAGGHVISNPLGLAGSGGVISISGGTITATGGTGDSGSGAAGIGGGSSAYTFNGGTGGTISISGGTITATCGAANGMDIGYGAYGASGTIEITGGSVSPTNGAAYVDSPTNGSANGNDPVGMLTIASLAGQDFSIITAGSLRTYTYSGTGHTAAAYPWLTYPGVTTDTATSTTTAAVVTAPSTVNSPASSTAALNGTYYLNNTYAVTSAYFEYGTSTGYGSSQAITPVSTVAPSVESASANITGLSPGTTYHYRFVIVTNGITIRGNNMTITTPSLAPSVDVTHAVTSTTAATLHGIYDLNGGMFVSGEFEISTDGGLNWSIPTGGTLSGGTTTPSVNLTGLTPGTVYHYRFTVINSEGSSTATGTFRTAFTITEKYVDAGGTPILDSSGVPIPDTTQSVIPGNTYNGTAAVITDYVCVGYRIGSATDTFATAVPGTSGDTAPAITGVTADRTVWFVYAKQVDLTVSKTVTGAYGDPDRTFEITITLEDSGTPGNGTYVYLGSAISGVTPPANGSITLNTSGQGILHLKHGQMITIQGLPQGYTYTVEETDAAVTGGLYAVTYSGTGTVPISGDRISETLGTTMASASIINDRSTVPASGVNGANYRLGAVGVLTVLAVALIILWSYRRRRKYR